MLWTDRPAKEGTDMIATIITSQLQWIAQHPGVSAAIFGLSFAALAAAYRFTR